MSSANSSSAAKDLRAEREEDFQPEDRTEYRNVLIVEDDPFSQKLFSHIVTGLSEDYHVTIAKNYREAMDYLTHSTLPQFAIIDIFLGGPESGIDLVEFLNQNFPDLPFVMTSSISEKQYHEMIDKLFLKPIYLKKPFQPSSCKYLLETLQQMHDHEVEKMKKISEETNQEI